MTKSTEITEEEGSSFTSSSDSDTLNISSRRVRKNVARNRQQTLQSIGSRRQEQDIDEDNCDCYKFQSEFSMAYNDSYHDNDNNSSSSSNNAKNPPGRASNGSNNQSRTKLLDQHEDEQPQDDAVSVENASYPSYRAHIVPPRDSNSSLYNRRRSRSRFIHDSAEISDANIPGSEGNIVDGNDEEENSIDFLKDPVSEMTWGRRLAIRLSNHAWYNPLLGVSVDDRFSQMDLTSRSVEQEVLTQIEIPSLKRAWAYFEHVVLTRYVVELHNIDTGGMTLFQRFLYSFTNFDEAFERAQPGEKFLPTRLYDPITTPHMQLGDFGLGFGLYFSTLRAIGYITFLAGVISTFNLYFFASDRYNDERLPSWLLYGSAICTRQQLVPCLDCDCNSVLQGWDRTDRCVEIDNPNIFPEPLTLTMKNTCLERDGAIWQLGMVNLGSMVFLFVAILLLGIYIEDQAVKFDEDEQTAQDYSIVISNPPPKANDPNQWKRYFETAFPGTKVAAVTCAVNNDLLIRALVRRREVLRTMELKLKPGTAMDIDNLALLAAKEARSRYRFVSQFMALFVPGLPELLSQLVALNTQIKGLAQLSYPCTNVFVTFEDERDQRTVLKHLSVGSVHVASNNTKALADPRYLFNGEVVLDVEESVEPNSVRWQDLNTTMSQRFDKMIMTNILTFFIIIVVGLIVTFADSASTIGAAFSIAGFNLAFPQLAKWITDIEAHPTESHLQTSLYFKIASFRWVNTAIVITVITPFTKTLDDDGLIPQIYAIFFAEIVTTNVIQLTDPWGHIQRHILAPRAKTQDSMNLCFQGLEVELAERYTNMTKIMFLAFWYSSIFPGALYLCSLTLCINYYTDRFSMMRSWKRAPHVSTEISRYSRHYFFSSACVILAVMTSFYWAAFPFDNLCPKEAEQIFDSAYYGTHFYDAIDKDTNQTIRRNITVAEDTPVFRFCQQDYILRPDGFNFPFMYREGKDGGEWMSQEQRRLSVVFGWASVAVLCVVGVKFLVGFANIFRGWFYGNYEEPGDDQGLSFHEVRNISGYIPQVRSSTFSYPLLACNCDDIEHHLFDWTDPDREYAYYDLTKDADHILTGTRRKGRHSFSRVKHWPPTRAEDIRRRKRLLELRIQKSRSIFNSSGSHHNSERMSKSTRKKLGKLRSSFYGSSSELSAPRRSSDASSRRMRYT